ncbi:MAG: diacylglycerol/lipid kinase family protein [Phycisphaerales bacterium]
MRVSIVYNPRSGRGKAERLTDQISELASKRGHHVEGFDISRGDVPGPGDLEGSDRLVIVGGDGTVHHLLPLLTQTQVPFQHCGTGTANLICHALKMSRRAAGVIEQMEMESEPRRIDVPLCNEHPFLIMTSLGMDASVIHRLEESRKLGGYRAYIRPVIKEVLSPRFAGARVRIDGQERPELSRAGVFVVANMPNYGGHFNPCRQACWDDRSLDIAHIAGRTSLTSGLRYLALFARLNAARCAAGREIVLEAIQDSCVQIDGEKPNAVPAVLRSGETLRFRVSEHSVYAHAPRLDGSA